MNSCHEEFVWLVSNRLKPVNRPIERITILGPYLSKAQPAKTADTPASSILTDKIAEVAARVKLNSLCMDLKKTPKENCIP
jgi:hypothetical protein